MATRRVVVPARGKREPFSFTYDAPESLNDAIAQLGGENAAFQAILAYLDHQAIAERTTEAQEHKMLLSSFHGALKYMSKTLGLEKAQEILISAGGYETLTDTEINETVDEIKNPKPRKKREKKAVVA